VGHESRAGFLTGLTQLAWRIGAPQDNNEVLDRYLGQQAYSGEMPASDVGAVNVDSIELSDLSACVDSILALDGTSKWMDRGAANLRAGCPITAGIIFKQLSLGPMMDLAECFMTELAVANNCLSRPDFAEGVRALLIDKDLSPQWTVAQIADLPQSLVDEHFVGYWEAEGGPHPLEDLPTFS
jgi:hypothetical protein